MESVIRSALEGALVDLGVRGVEFTVEHPNDPSHGDYATNAALIAAQASGQTPRECAEVLTKKLEGTLAEVERIEVAGPGFINFILKRDFFVREIRGATGTWGKNSFFSGEEILFEYTSPNLFKPLHVGNLVGNIVGESISRLLESSGGTVRRINYPSDIGLTVAKGVWGLRKTGGDPGSITALGEAYRLGNEAYETDDTSKEEIEKINRLLYEGSDPELNELRRRGIETSRRHLGELCAKLGTAFDAEIFESEAGPVGKGLVEKHLGSIFEKSDGAVVFKGEHLGLHTRVFLNSQGLPTYEAKDLGNFELKQRRYPGWTQYFVVTGAEQREYFKVVIAVVREIFEGARNRVVEHIPTGFLTLTTGKMSSRRGNVLTGESLLLELEEEAKVRAAETRVDDVDALASDIAVAALKYQILRQGIGSDIVFDKARALSFEGDSGPYLQYTHARIASVLEKAKELGIAASTENPPPEPYEIERLIYQYPEVVARAARERAPHYVVTYITELAGTFNTFYAHEQIADPNDAYAPYKLAVAASVRAALQDALFNLGIKAPERM